MREEDIGLINVILNNLRGLLVIALRLCQGPEDREHVKGLIEVILENIFGVDEE